MRRNTMSRVSTLVIVFCSVLFTLGISYYLLPSCTNPAPVNPRKSSSALNRDRNPNHRINDQRPEQKWPVLPKDAPDAFPLDAPLFEDLHEEEPVRTELTGAKFTIPGTDIVVDKDFPILFIGGVPRSGTTLMRVIADAHSNLHCGEETRVIPRITTMRRSQLSKIELARYEAAKIPQEILEDSARNYIIEILLAQFLSSPESQRHDVTMLCDKDPFVLSDVEVASQMFHNSKFILMIRDGRAVAHSLITRKVTISKWNLNSWTDVLKRWNQTVSRQYDGCVQAGPEKCLPVFYEQLVLQPNRTIHQIMSFLGLPWEDVLLHHQDQIGKDISISKLEPSSDQVAKPINLLGLTSWVGNIPENVLPNMAKICPALRRFGYDPEENTNPFYGPADKIVMDNLKLLRQNPSQFEVDTYKWDRKTGGIDKGQFGHDEMARRQQEALDKLIEQLQTPPV